MNQLPFDNIAEAVRHEAERLNSVVDVPAHWDKHPAWLWQLAEILDAAAKQKGNKP